MDLVSPEPGLLFWTSLSFIILILVMKKYAWGPIMQAVSAREEMIEGAIVDSLKARKEIDELVLLKKSMMDEAKKERNSLIKEANDLKTQLIDEARLSAQKDAELIISNARAQIQQEKLNAIRDIKNQVAILSVDIAGMLIKEELNSSQKQQSLIDNYLKDVTFN